MSSSKRKTTTVTVRESVEPLQFTAIVVISGSFESGEKILHCLNKQTIARQMEVIVASNANSVLEKCGSILKNFGASRTVLGDTHYLPQLRADCAQVASSPVVGFNEDHSFPEPNWAEEIAKVFNANDLVKAVCPAFVNPNSVSAISRAQYGLFFGSFDQQALTPGETVSDSLAWHNSAYRRGDLLKLGDQLGSLLEVELYLIKAVCGRDHEGTKIVTNRTVVHHVNMSESWAARKHARTGGRLFAQHRAAKENWSALRRWSQTLACPLIPLLRLFRARRELFKGLDVKDRFRVGVAAGGLLINHAFGEAVGNVAEPIDVVRRYSDFESCRDRFLLPSEKKLVYGDAA